ncbi:MULTISPECIES: hypothetical protein [Amycolatopsis]|uniref:Sigma-70 family RNA polymerase sigma factor n=1 Tax=Amycolatopsis dongchuanensis TaxID=1070866 RepID=A0ABP9Q5C4_9PSEU
MSSEFEGVRRESDPIRQGQRATELLAVYQQRATELARLRRDAIERAHRELGLSYTEIATRLGITKGRVTQIRSTAPAPERAFFGVGPVSVGVPYRYQTTDRERPLIAAEDAKTGEQVVRLLESLTFATSQYQIEPDRTAPPAGDTVVVCGPKSAPIGAWLLDQDPALAMVNDSGRWWIEEAATGKRHGSPSDDAQAAPADLAYVGRHIIDGRVVVHIAGVHSIGSLGAADYLVKNLADLFAKTAETPCSLIVRAGYDGLDITHSELAAGPFLW